MIDTIDIFTIGGIDFLIQVFRAINLVFGDSTWKTMAEITFVYAFFMAFLIGIRKNTYPIWWIVSTFFAFHILFSAKINVNLIDTKLGKTYVIEKVPFGIGIATSFLSNMSYYMTNFIDTAFHTGITYVYGGRTQNSYPQVLDFSKNGYAGIYEYFDRMRKMQVDKYLSPDKREIINAYLTQCLLLDMSSWSYDDIKAFQFSPDVINQDKLRVKNNLIMSYKGQTFYCLDFYDNYAKKAFEDFVKLIENNTALLAIFRDPSTLKQDMSNVVNSFTNGNQTFGQLIGNSAVREALKNAYLDVASSSNELSQNVVLGYMKGEAEGRLMLMAKSFFMFAAEWIPMLNNVLQFVLIGIMPFTALVILIPGMLSLIRKFLLTITWVYLWSPIFALVDGIHKTAAIAQAQNYVSTLYSTIGFGIGSGINLSTAFSIASAGGLYEITDDMKALAGFLSLFVPGIAWMVLTASDHVISSFGSMLASHAGRVSTPEAMTQAITAERVGMSLSGGELGHGVAVRQAVWGNAYSMTHSYATNAFGMDNVGDVFKSSIYGTAKNTGIGSNMYDTFKGDASYMKDWGASAAPKELTEGLMFNGRLSQAIQHTADRTYSQVQSQAVKDIWQAGEKYAESRQFSDSVMYATSKAWNKSDGYIRSNYAKYSEAVETFRGIQEETSNMLGLSKKDSSSVANELFAVGAIDGSLLKKASLGDKGALNKLRAVFSKVQPKFGSEIKDDQLQEWAKAIDTKYGEKISSGDTFKQLVQMEQDFKHDNQAKKELNYAVKGEEGTKINWNEDLTWGQSVSNEIDKVKSIQEKLSDIKTGASAYELQYGHQFLQYVADEFYGGNLAKAKANINYATPQQMEAWVSDFMKEKLGIDFNGKVDMNKLENASGKFNQEIGKVNLEDDREKLKFNQMKKMGGKFVEDHENGTDVQKGKEGILTGQSKYATQNTYFKNKNLYDQQIGAAKTEINGGKNYINAKSNEIQEDSNTTKQDVEENINLTTPQRVSRLGSDYKDHLAMLALSTLGTTGLDILDAVRDKGNMHYTTVDTGGRNSHRTGSGPIHGGRTPPGLEVPQGKTERSWRGRVVKVGSATTVAGTALEALPFVGTSLYFANEARKEGKEIIMSGYQNPISYTANKIFGWVEDGYDHVKEFLTGNYNHQQVRKFQADMYKPINK